MEGGGEYLLAKVERLLAGLSEEERKGVLPKLTQIVNSYLSKGETVVLARERIGHQADMQFEGTNAFSATNFYVIRDKLGEGGMGKVYKAFDVQLERHVALKVLKNADEETVERFVRERKVTAELDHPNFVRILTIGFMDTPEGKQPFYTMPLIRGDTLEELISRRVLPGEKGEKLRNEFTPTRLLQVAQQICQTLQSAHDKHIIHRDLKPANIIVGPYGETYVMDLGLAKRLKDSDKGSGRLEAHIEKQFKHKEEKNLTMDAGIGTPYYMAPEQILTPQQVDHRTDIFGLGGILYYILTGQRPQYVLPPELSKYGFTSDTVDYFAFSETMKECKIVSPSKIVTEQREKLKKIHELGGFSPRMPDSIDSALEAVCMKALAKKPEDRYQSCREMWQELQQFIEGNPEMILEREGKELTKVMSKKNLDEALEDFEMAEMRVQESINKLEKIGRMAFEEKLKMIDLQIGKSRVYDQRGQSSQIIKTIENAKNLIEAPLNAAQKQYIRLLIMEGLAKFNQKNYGEAKERQMKAIEMCRTHPDKKLLISAYHNYGLACTYEYTKNRDLADFNKGRNALTECYKIADLLGDVFSSVHARTMLASLLMEKTECVDEAKLPLEEGLTIAGNDSSLLAEIHTNLSTYYLKRKDHVGAINHGELAVKFATEADAQVYLHESKLILGKAYHVMGDHSKRVENLKPLLTFDYPREPSFKEEIREFYVKNDLDLKELG